MANKPVASIARLRAANNNAYDAQANPNGLAQGGHRQNWVPNAGAEVDVAEWVADLSVEVEADAQAVDAAAMAAELSRQQAATKAGEAATSATNAAASAARLMGTSTTSRTPAVGSLQFTTQADKAFDVGTWLMVQSRGTVGRWAFGKVTAYAGTSVTIAVEAIGPTVSAGTDWNMLVSGGRGGTGPQAWLPPVAWASGVAYVVGPPASVVVYQGESYVCISAHTSSGTILPTDTTRWTKITAKGADGVTQDISGKANLAGATFTGPVALAINDLGTFTTGTVTFNYASKNKHRVTVNGAVSFDATNLPADGSGELEVIVTFTSGSIAFPAAWWWKVGDGTQTQSFSAIGLTLTAGGRYRLVLQVLDGQTHAVIA